MPDASISLQEKNLINNLKKSLNVQWRSQLDLKEGDTNFLSTVYILVIKICRLLTPIACPMTHSVEQQDVSFLCEGLGQGNQYVSHLLLASSSSLSFFINPDKWLDMTLDLVFFHIRQENNIFICNNEDCILALKLSFLCFTLFPYHIYAQGHLSLGIEAP